MTKVAILGHSHVGALKLGWDQLQSTYPDVEITFFASTGTAARGMGLIKMQFGYHTDEPHEEECIFGNSGARRIDLTTFDHVIYAGREMQEEDLADVLALYDIDGAPQAGLERRMSASAFEALLEALSQQRIKPRPWQNWGTPQLWIQPKPYPDTRCLESGAPRYLPWCRLCATPERLHWMRARYWPRLTEAFAKSGAHLLPHPQDTMTDIGLTDPAYSEGALRLLDGSRHPEEEFDHMNSAYGVLVMKNFLSRCLAPGRDLKTGT